MKFFYTIFSCFLFFCSSLFGVKFTGIVLKASAASAGLNNVSVQLIESSTLETTTQVTGEDGKFSFDVDKGTYCLILSKNRFQLFATAISLTKATNLTSVLNHSFKDGISGTVTDSASSAAIDNATVTLFYNSYPIFTTTTDENGFYETPQIIHEYGADYTLSASKTGYQTNNVAAEENLNGSTTNISIAIDHARLSGKISASVSGDGIEGALVSVQSDGQTVGLAATDSDGNYSIEGLAAKSYNVIVTANGYKNSLEGVEVNLNSTTIYNVSLELNGGEILGRVLDEESGLPTAGIAMTLQLDGVTIQNATTDSNGEYSFQNLGEDLYVIIAGGNNHETGYSKARIVGTDPITVNFTLGSYPGSIVGEVTDGSLPLAGARIVLKQNDITLQTYLTKTDGKYSIIGLAAGNYIGYASEDGYQTAIHSITVQNSGQTTANFTLEEGSGAIEGTVTEQGSGDPIPGAHIKIVQNDLVYAEAISASDGKYSVQGLPSGTYSLNAGANGFQYAIDTASVVIDTPATVVNFMLSSGGSTVTGIITNAITGLPIDAAVVRVEDQGSEFFEYTVTQENGEYRIQGLFSATYVISAMKDTFITNTTSPFVVSTSIDTDITKDLTLTTQNPAINNLKGNAFSNWSLLAEDRIHQISWTTSSSNDVIGYRVYRNGVLVKSIGENEPYFYESHNNPIGDTVLYAINSVNSNGSQSAATNISLQ